MSVRVSTCSKSSLPVEHRVIQSIYSEVLHCLAYSKAWANADTPQKDSYRSEQGCQLFEGEVPWKVQLMSSAFFPPQPLIHCSWRGRKRRRCSIVNAQFSVPINDKKKKKNKCTVFFETKLQTHFYTTYFWAFWECK